MDAHRGCDDGMADFLWTQSVVRWRGHDAFTDIQFSARSRGLPSHSEEETKGKAQSGNYKGHEGSRRHQKHEMQKDTKICEGTYLRAFLRGPSWPSWLQVFEDSGGAHASADAHCHHPVARVTALQFADHACG